LRFADFEHRRAGRSAIQRMTKNDMLSRLEKERVGKWLLLVAVDKAPFIVSKRRGTSICCCLIFQLHKK
jgi:hypothetical protein